MNELSKLVPRVLGPEIIQGAPEIRTSILSAAGRLVVCCEIDHFIPSGLAVPELFARLRPQLVAAIEDAASRDPADAVRHAPRMHMDVGSPDPGITLWVHSPALGLEDLGVCLGQLEAIVTRFVDGHRFAASRVADLVCPG